MFGSCLNAADCGKRSGITCDDEEDNMDKDSELQNLKERLDQVESQLRRKSNSSGPLRFIIWTIVILFGALALIGIFQFIGSSSSN